MEKQPLQNEYPPIKPGEIFDAEKAIREIVKVPKEERREKLEEFKEKLAFQQVGLARVQDIVIDEIRSKPDGKADDFYDLAVEMGAEFGMNERQKKETGKIIDRYDILHKGVENIRKKFPNTNDLFKELFFAVPKGRVELIVGPVSLYFKCYDFEDYLTVFYSNQRSHHGKKRDFTEEEKKEAEGCKAINVFSMSHPEIGRAVMAENDSGVGKNPKEGESAVIFAHEEQHAINSLFDKEILDPNDPINVRNVRQSFLDAETMEEKEKILMNFFRQFRKNAEAFAKDEMIAHYKDGHDDMAFIELLTEKSRGGIYDYLEEQRKANYLWMKADDKTRALTEKTVQKILVEEYKNNINNASLAVYKMEKAGYEKEEIIALLTHEPLAKWGKVVGRVLESEGK
ncbi:MAG: hypothetical protein WCT49_05935 [Candidatus Paceibacterota bacterium]|jgi:hypothetical protein|nr:hypothetical protein [Candidatus Paceibacterota bacterium]